MANSNEKQENVEPVIKKQTKRHESKPRKRKIEEKSENTLRVKKQKNAKANVSANISTKASVSANTKTRSTRSTRNAKTQKRVRRNTKEQSEEVRMKKSPLKIIPLGGLLEIGKNITVFEYEDEIIIVDCRTSFPNRRHARSRPSSCRHNISRKKQRKNKRTSYNTWA